MLVQLTPDGAALCEQCHQVVGQKLHQELTKNLSADEVAMLEQLLKKGPAVKIRRGKMMSRRNNDAILIHSILSWIEDNFGIAPVAGKSVTGAPVTPKWHLQRMFKRDRPFPRPVHPQPQADGGAQKLKQSNEPILYWRNAMVSSRSRP